MVKYRVIAEFIDATTGKRVQPGVQFDVDGERAARLIAAGVLEGLPATDAPNDTEATRPSEKAAKAKRKTKPRG